MEVPTAYDYMVGLLAVLQDMREDTNKLQREAEKLTINFKELSDSKNVNASNLYTNLEGLVSDYDLADIHNEYAQKRVASIMEHLKKKEEAE